MTEHRSQEKMESQAKNDQFISILEAHKGILFKVSNSYCQDPDDRNDLIQEIIIQLWRSFEKYDDQYKYSTWIYRIALNVAISFYRRENRRKAISYPITERILEIADTNSINETDQNIAILYQFISQLKELDKALMLLYLDSRSHREISEIIGISETNVATKIGRIKVILKQKFSNL